MGKLLPTGLNTATTIDAADTLLTQKNGDTEIKQITGANFFANYYTTTEVDTFISASAYGIKYVWADLTAQNAEVGMVALEQGLREDERIVYSYNGATWDALYNLDVAGTLLTTDIGTTVQGYDATLLNDADIGVSVQGYDSTILVDADIGVTVAAFGSGLQSDPSGITGATAVTNIVQISQVDYDALGSYDASTVYIIN